MFRLWNSVGFKTVLATRSLRPLGDKVLNFFFEIFLNKKVTSLPAWKWEGIRCDQWCKDRNSWGQRSHRRFWDNSDLTKNCQSKTLSKFHFNKLKIIPQSLVSKQRLAWTKQLLLTANWRCRLFMGGFSAGFVISLFLRSYLHFGKLYNSKPNRVATRDN